MAPGILFHYLIHESEINRAIYRTLHWHACHRRLEMDLPETPSYGQSIELVSDWDTGLSSKNDNVLDLVSNPFLYLDSFQFVEHRGQRYSGLASDYQVMGYDKPIADFTVSIACGHELGVAPFYLCVIDRSNFPRRAKG